MHGRDDAAALLVGHPECTDAAVEALESLSRSDPLATSDLSAAYLIRAERLDHPTDYLRALEAAMDAVAAAPDLPAARFNQALAEEALGLRPSWEEAIRRGGSGWAAEARAHRDSALPDAASQWNERLARLPDALRAHDVESTSRLIAPFPSTAEDYLYETVLRAWAEAPSAERLRQAMTLAAALQRATGDSLAVEAVEAIPRAPEALARGHLLLADALQTTLFDRKKGRDLYKQAAIWLDRGKSPLALLPRLQLAVYEPTRNELPAIETAAHYGHMTLGRWRWIRAFLLANNSRHVEAVAEYAAAARDYSQAHCAGCTASTHVREGGVLGNIGQRDAAWREVLKGLSGLDSVVEPQWRHGILGEAQGLALRMNYPRTALLYANETVRMLKAEMRMVPPEYATAAVGNLGSALLHRAGIEHQLQRPDSAAADLNESQRLGARVDQDARVALAVRIDETNAQMLLPVNPLGAAAAFTRALDKAGPHDLTHRASLLSQRGEAFARAGRDNEAERDLRDAVNELDREADGILERRGPAGEPLWSDYFARVHPVCEALIAHLLAKGRAEDAFKYSEGERAYELMDLARRRNVVPTSDVNARAALPSGTSLIEYWVMESGTVAWIVSRDQFEVVRLRPNRARVESLSRSVERAVRQKNEMAFESALLAPYKELIEPVLARMQGKVDRIVFIPDGAINGLPFSALRGGRGQPYLFQRYTLAVAPSASFYLFSLARDAALPRNDASALLVGNPTFDRALPFAAGLDSLTHADREVSELAASYAQSDVLRGAEATVPAFLAAAPRHAVVHVAAHALANADTPSQSMLLFAPSPNEPGVLTAEDLLARLQQGKTRLVILGTCSSAGGLPVGPEGVAPLVRPLMGAGIPGVVGTLWSIEDATAERFLVSFHTHYRRGEDAATALRSAQLELLKGAGNAPAFTPRFAWAAFQVIGHASSPFAPARDKSKEKPP